MQSTSNSITIDKLIQATPQMLWNAWTEPELILQWFGSDPKGWGIQASIDLHVGGKFEVSFSNSDGAEHTCSGTYRQIIECSRLQFTWSWKSEPGVESLVSVELKPQHEFTRMQFEHARLTGGSAHDYQLGWTSTFEKLDRLVSTMK
jgi:uncharacterized protein YndB with AHSA1/START domain